MLCAFEVWSGFCTFNFLKRFNTLGISTKLTILCCFSLTTDPATWKNSRHLSKGFLSPLVFGSFSLLPACVLCTLTGCVHFFSSFLFAYPHWLQVLVVLAIFLALHQNGSFYGGECNLFYFYFLKNMLVKSGLFYDKVN